MIKAPQPKVLNLFAYTGGASLAATGSMANTHVDSIKQVVTWSQGKHGNFELNKHSLGCGGRLKICKA